MSYTLSMRKEYFSIVNTAENTVHKTVYNINLKYVVAVTEYIARSYPSNAEEEKVKIDCLGEVSFTFLRKDAVDFLAYIKREGNEKNN